MATSFPASPTSGDQHTIGLSTWEFDGDAWNKLADAGPYRAIPSAAIAEGATTPNPGYPTWAWSTTLDAPMFWNVNQGRWKGVKPIHVGVTPPDDPEVGDLWLDIN